MSLINRYYRNSYYIAQSLNKSYIKLLLDLGYIVIICIKHNEIFTPTTISTISELDDKEYVLCNKFKYYRLIINCIKITENLAHQL